MKGRPAGRNLGHCLYKIPTSGAPFHITCSRWGPDSALTLARKMQSVKRRRLLASGSPPFVPKLDLGRALVVQNASAGLLGGDCRIYDSAHSLSQARAPGVEESLDRICRIRAQAPTVVNLNRRRSALPRALGICAGAFAANELHSGILPEPSRQRRRFPGRKETNRGAPFKAHQNRAVTLPSLHRPVIDSDDIWSGGRWQLNLANPLNDRVRAEAHPQRDGQARSSLAA
jgi:hypothetical protein